MAVSTVTTDRYAYVKQYEYRSKPGRVCSKLNTYVNRRLYQTTVQTRSPVARVRPDPLFMHPTGQEKVYKQVSRGEITRKKIWTSNTVDCEYRSYSAPIMRYATGYWNNDLYKPDTSYWQNDLRNALASYKSLTVGESVFEYRETAKLFYQVVMALKWSWDQYRSGKKRLIRKLTLDDIPAAELQFAFGVAPLLGTFHDVHKSLEDRLVEPIYIRIAGRVQDRVKTKFSFGSVYKGVNDNMLDWDRQGKYCFYVKFIPENIPQFFMGNPFLVAWELTPLSWLVDGLIDVGGYLSALDYLGDRYSSCTGTYSEKDTIRMRFSQPYYVTEETVKPGYSFLRSHVRYAYGDLPDAVLPKYRPSKSWRKIMHATSVLWLMRASSRKVGN